MYANDIKDIIKVVGSLKLEHFELEKGDVRLVIKNSGSNNPDIKIDQSSNVSEEDLQNDAKKLEVQDNKEDELMYIKSPMVGTCYLSSSPDAKTFVEVGTRVKAGDVLCIIEAMKVMNEIVSEFDGEIVEVLAQDDEVVEYGQPIIVLKK